MKKFIVMLLIAGMTGHTSAMGIFHIDFDVGYLNGERFDHPYRPSSQASCIDCNSILNALQKTNDDRKHPDKKDESQNVTQKTDFHYYIVPLLLQENEEDKFHHQVHTHDVPCWNCLRNSKDVLPAALCRLKHQKTCPEKENFGTYLLPIYTE